MMRKITIAAAVAAASLAGTAQAAITVFTTNAAFNAATMTPGVDTFETLSITGVTPSPITRTAGVYGYTATALNDFFGAGSTTDRWLSTNTATDVVTFNAFTGGVSAIGGLFFTSDLAGAFAPGGVTLTAIDSLGATATQVITASTITSFRGFVSNGTITSLTLASIQPTTGFLWPTANNLTLARAALVTPVVPEPTSWAMMILGMGSVGFAMRRRQKVTTRVSYAA